MTLADRVRAAVRAAQGPVCVGLDPDPEKLPPGEDPLRASLALCHRAMDATRGVAAAYKPNSAFFEALGGAGFDALAEVRAGVRGPALSILDAKRGDVGSTARMYAKWAFGRLGYDAVTLHPLLGWDSIAPFLEYPERGVFLLVRTSNPGARDFQDLRVEAEPLPASGEAGTRSRSGQPLPASGEAGTRSRSGEPLPASGEAGTRSRGAQPLYLAIAARVRAWSEEHDGIGAVCGATWPEELAKVRRVVGDDVPILVPGVGAQGGSAREVVRAAGTGPLLISSSRGILHAGDGSEAAMREAAERLRAECRSP